MKIQKFAAASCAVVLGVFLSSCGPVRQFGRDKYLQQGKEAYAKGLYKDASLAFRKALQRDPNSGDAAYRLALAELQMLENPDRIVAALQLAVGLDPENIDAKVHLANVYIYGYLQDGTKPQAVRSQIEGLSRALLKRDPNSFDALRISASLALIDGKPKEAVDGFARAQKVKPWDQHLVLPYVQALQLSGQPDEAGRIAREQIRRTPGAAAVYDALYRQLMAARRATEAEELLKLKCSASPNDPAPILQLAAHYFRTSRAAEMKAILDAMLSAPARFPRSRLQAADFYRSIGNIPEARSLYEAGLKGASGEEQAEYRKRLGSLLVLEGKREDAVKLYEDVLKSAPKDAEGREARAVLLLEKDVAKAAREFEELVKINPGSPSLHHNLGLAYLALRDLEQARTNFLEASRRQRTFLPSRLALAQMNLDAGRFREVLQYADEILATSPAHPEARYYRSAGLAGTGKLSEARMELNRLLKQFPQYPEPRLQLALLNLAEKRFKEAESSLTAMYKEWGDVRALKALVRVYMAQNQADTAMRMVEGEFKKRQDSPRIRLLLAETAASAGHHKTAIEHLLKLAEQDPNWDYLYMGLGEAHQASGDMVRATLAFEKAVQMAPKSLEAGLKLAYAYEISGQPQKAIEAYRRTLSINPNIPIAMNNLAYLLSENNGNLDEALRLAQRARQYFPQERYIADTVGWIYLKRKELTAASQIFRTLVQKYPEEAVFRYHYGASLLEAGDRARAKTELLAALDRKPTGDQEKRIRELLSRIG
jgi:tetratricopeptide (TPR) repeat protein